MTLDLSSQLDSADDLVALGERMVYEFAGVVPAGTVLQSVLRCRDQLLGSGLRHGLIPATEAAVRVSLAAAFAPARTG